jgi:hypothetical protein
VGVVAAQGFGGLHTVHFLVAGGGSLGSMTSEGQRNRLGCKGSEVSLVLMIIGSAGAGVFFYFFTGFIVEIGEVSHV